MASMSKGYAFNAGKRDPLKSRVISYKGTRRAEKWPSGKIERFVDLQGNVVTRQLVAPGIPPTEDRINAARAHAHLEKNADGSVQGSIEHGRCPLKHGVRFLTPTIEAEFSELPDELQRPCSEESPTVTRGKAGVLDNHDGCPHIEWLIKSRRARQAALLATKRTIRPDFQEEQLSLAKQQVEETRKANEAMVQAVTAATKRNGKASAE